MGCLNAGGGFEHWFGNIHLSGPCNRSCYFCIGQHMMALDSFNNLNSWPLHGWDWFLAKCRERDCIAIYLTGTNTDPLLYRHMAQLAEACGNAGFPLGIRTNGVAFSAHKWRYFTRASVTVCSTDDAVNAAMMGGPVADLPLIIANSRNMDLKINVVLGPENRHDLETTLDQLAAWGIKRVNLREPYGQPHQGNPLEGRRRLDTRLGMPAYDWREMVVVYWDVHYCEVESVNLYASGRVSETYPITKGCADDGIVQPQSAFAGGRVRAQWLRQG